ncbi:zinc finger protein 184-like isoform X2 [Helicoverpa zea]|uniref:zinc finger protein 184-like isoform X2 n=1 Tax=Helicoverpa zea TaxID=7113 RepID=UPI001F5AB6EC|nr:zinc finger protein 184-like isoform X2 [Helicoverpa zea]
MSGENTEVETYFGKCRCCLSYGYLKNMWIEHKYEGETEIYGEMLVQCFALTWNISEEAMDHDQICESCIGRLRDANEFKKIVMDAQEELLQQVDVIEVKEEKMEAEFLEDNESDGDIQTEYAEIEPKGESVQIETEYEEVEYLEEDDDGTNQTVDTDSSQLTDQPTPARRKKQPRKQDPDEDEPKRKWPKKLPKAERHKTYKQYSEEDLRNCLEEVRNQELSINEAARRYNIPMKTICGRLREEPKDVQIDNTTRSKLEPNVKKTSTVDAKTKKLIELNKLKEKRTNLKAKNVKKVSPSESIEPNEEMDDPVDAEKMRTQHKAIVNDKFKEGNEMNKHRENIKTILINSNATLIKAVPINGFYCHFCGIQTEKPLDLKRHNLASHSVVNDEVIKVKYVSNLVLKLDITDLKCKLCDKNIDTLEDFFDHLTKIHDKVIHTDIKNHIIPFKFNTESLQCVICRREYKFFKLLSEHMSDHYRNYECSSCERAFINKQAMQTHSYRHNKGLFKCSHCPKIFDSRPKINEHERVVHAWSSKTRKCAFCSKRFPSKDMVQKHEVKIHGAEPTIYSCDACDKAYTSQGSLIAHRNRFHLMARPHKCSFCEMAFYSKMELKSHTVTHTKTREFKCGTCSKTFGTRCNLNQHARSHSDDRRYHCVTCDHGFVHRTTWRVHMRTQHGKIV